jgi:hypothetical protein
MDQSVASVPGETENWGPLQIHSTSRVELMSYLKEKVAAAD